MKIGILLVLICVIMVSGCAQSPTQQQVKDCKRSSSCFVEAAKTCSPAKTISAYSYSKEENPFAPYMEIYQELKGMSDGECVFYMRVNSLQMKLPEVPEFHNDTDFNYTYTLDMLRKINGSDMTCRIGKSNFSYSNFSSIMDIYYEKCDGSFKDYTDQLWEYIQSELKKMLSAMSLQTVDYYCAGGTINFIARNRGENPITPADFTEATVDGESAIQGLNFSSLEPSESGKIFSWNCGGECGPGVYEIALKTAYTSVKVSVACN